MPRDLVPFVCLVAAFSCVAAGARAETGASAPSPAPAAASPWKLIFENSQAAYYIDARTAQPVGLSDVSVLQDYKVAQVVDGAQVWSMISAMKLNCDENQILTLNNTLFALKTGAGPVVATQAVTDTWHSPQPDSLGGLVLSTACAKP